jgi:DnaJ like chaperone protein
MKWAGAFLGFIFRGVLGAILGFFVGSILDGLFSGQSNGGRSVFGDFAKPNVSPADFELNLLSLCSIVIKADGSISQRELDYVRQYFIATYGKEKANAIFRTFNEVIKKREISAQRICNYLNQRTRYEVRLQLLHFLFGIAQSDGRVSQPELDKLNQLAGFLRIGNYDFNSIKAMFFKEADQAYKILEIQKSATDDEVKKAYRKMAKKFHPDRVVTQDEAIKKGAEEKFKQVQKAYETIQKERGMS